MLGAGGDEEAEVRGADPRRFRRAFDRGDGPDVFRLDVGEMVGEDGALFVLFQQIQEPRGDDDRRLLAGAPDGDLTAQPLHLIELRSPVRSEGTGSDP